MSRRGTLSEIEDRDLISLIEQHRPAHIIIAIGSGAQEKLGYICGKICRIGRRSIAPARRLD